MVAMEEVSSSTVVPIETSNTRITGVTDDLLTGKREENNNSKLLTDNDFHNNAVKGNNNEKGGGEDDDEVNISKAMRFWKHQSLRDIPTEQKFGYLREKGVTDKQIHEAWDRIISEGEVDGHEGKGMSSSSMVTNLKPKSSPSVTAPNQNQQNQPAPSSSPPPPPPQNHAVQQAYNTNYPSSSSQQPPNATTGNYGGGGGGGGIYSHNNYDPTTRQHHQQQQQQQQQQQYGYYDDQAAADSMSIAQGISLVALGGFLGVTAAAAARWLNGGDFQFLPPPTLKNDNESNQQRLTIDHQRQQRNPNEDDDDDDDDEEEDGMFEGEEDSAGGGEEYGDDEGIFHDVEDITKQQIISEKLDSISKTFQSYVNVQENILHKLSTTNTTTNNSTITNSSMEFLRSNSSRLKEKASSSNSTTTNNNINNNNNNNSGDFVNILIQLVEIKSELRRLNHHYHHSSTTTATEENEKEEENPKVVLTEQQQQISKSLTKLDDCLDKIVVSVIGTTTTTDGNKNVENSVGCDMRNNDLNNSGNNDILLNKTEEESTTTEEEGLLIKPSSTRDVAPTAETTMTGQEDVQTTLQKDGSRMDSSAGLVPNDGRLKEEEVEGAVTTAKGIIDQRPSDSTKKKDEIVNEEEKQETTSTTATTKQLTLYEAVEILAGDENNDPTSLRIGCQILYLYFVNLVNKPDNIRYRKIYTSNESYSKIDNLKGAKELLFCVGFQLSEKGDYLEWLPKSSTDDGQDNQQQQEEEDLYLPKLKQGVSVLSILKSGKPNLKDAALTAISSSV